MKKLSILFLLIFVPLFFVACMGNDDPPSKIRTKAFENFNNGENYSCTLTYTDGTNNIVETCFFDTIFEYENYYYSYAKNGDIERQYWVSSRNVVSYVFKDLNNQVSTHVSSAVMDTLYEASENFDLFRKSTFNYSKSQLSRGELVEKEGVGDFNLTLGEYEFVVENNEIKQINHKDWTLKFNPYDATKIPYCDFSKKNSPDADKNNFDSAIEKIEKLEELAQTYITQKNLKVSKRYLALNYIRSGKASYCTDTWTMLLGSVNTDFATFVAKNEGESDVSSLRTLFTLNCPFTSSKIDFMHLIAVLSFGDRYGINNGATDLGGFGGDIAQLVLDIKDVEEEDGTPFRETLLNAAREKMASQSSGFNMEDYCADIAAINLIADLTSNKDLTLGQAIKNYYYSNHDVMFASKRALTLLNLPTESFDETNYLLTQRLSRNTYIQLWLKNNNVPLTTGGKNAYLTHFEVCTEAFLTFLKSCI